MCAPSADAHMPWRDRHFETARETGTRRRTHAGRIVYASDARHVKEQKAIAKAAKIARENAR